MLEEAMLPNIGEFSLSPNPKTDPTPPPSPDREPPESSARKKWIKDPEMGAVLRTLSRSMVPTAQPRHNDKGSRIPGPVASINGISTTDPGHEKQPVGNSRIPVRAHTTPATAQKAALAAVASILPATQAAPVAQVPGYMKPTKASTLRAAAPGSKPPTKVPTRPAWH